MLRQPRDGEDLLDAVELSGASARSLSGSLTLTDGGTDAERFTARIMAAVANKSSADTVRRVAAARERLTGQSYQGGRRPYGYQVDPDTEQYHRTLVTDEDEAVVIKAAAADILDRGISLKAIAADLRARRVLTVIGAEWTASALRDVLSKPAVAGLAVCKGELREAPWPPVLDRDVWDRLRDLFESRANPGTSNEPRRLLSCYATCGVCGGPVKCSGTGKRRGYTCIAHGHVRRSAAAVDAYGSAVMVARLSQPDAADLLKPPLRPGTDAGKPRAEARKLRAKSARMGALFAADVITEAQLTSGTKEIRDRLAKVSAQLVASDAPDPLPEFRGSPAWAVWDHLSLPRRRAVVRVLCTVAIMPVAGRGTGFDPDAVTVTWRGQEVCSSAGQLSVLLVGERRRGFGQLPRPVLGGGRGLVRVSHGGDTAN
jgi:Recombinase